MAEENAPQARAFIAFGAQQAIWEDYTPDVQAALGRIARAIAAFQPVTVYCRPEERRLAEHHCARPASASRKRRWTILDTRHRPGLPGRRSGSVAGVDFNFNGWGDKQRHGADSRLAKTMCDGLDIDHLRSDLVGEGGGIETDGLGTAIMTESSWLNDNRNPRWTKAEIEQALAHDLGSARSSGCPASRAGTSQTLTSTSMPALPAPAWSSPTWTWIRIPTTTN